MTKSLILALALVAGCGRDPGGGQPIDARAPALAISRPSDRTVAMIRHRGGIAIDATVADGPIRDQVLGYLHDLARRCDGALVVHEIDAGERAPLLAIARGGAQTRVALPRMLHDAQRDLPELDDRVAHAIATLAKPRVILLGDPVRSADEHAPPYATLAHLLGMLDLPIERAATLDASITPDTIVVTIADGTAPSDAAMAAIDRHLARGGRALIALEPVAGVGLGPLEQRLGLRYVARPLRSDLFVGKVRGAVDAHQLVGGRVDTRHAITTMIDRSAGALVLFLGSGWLEPVPGDAKPVIAIREVAGTTTSAPPGPALVAAIETASGGRAVVAADATWLADLLQQPQVGGQTGLLIDTFAWLGDAGDEQRAPGPLAPTTY